MNFQNTSFKLFSIACVALICLIASTSVFSQVSQRENRYIEAETDIASIWGSSQTFLGPVLVFDLPETSDEEQEKKFILPENLTLDTTLEPETRSRGIFDTVVYTEKIHVTGTFKIENITSNYSIKNPALVVSIADTRSIEKQLTLTWNNVDIEFEPSTGNSYFGDSGIHANVPVSNSIKTYTFDFTVQLHGSGDVLFAPVGKETSVSMNSTWPSPKFIGSYLPIEKTLDEEGFTATWHVSSFGRNYPQTWTTGDKVSYESILNSTFGVSLFQGVTLYTQVIRCIKYAILFILMTFTSFFLFDVIKKVKVHPIQYLLIGSALALFYLLLLSLAEILGFMIAYLISATLIIGTITAYSISILKAGKRAWLICSLLSLLYTYLYIVLQLETYALLFGSLLIFFLLSTVMYLTRKIDWFSSIS